MRRLLVCTAVAAATCATFAVTAGSASAAPSAPYVRGAQTVPVYSYAKAIHETVFVRAPFDSDHDGVRDGSPSTSSDLPRRLRSTSRCR